MIDPSEAICPLRNEPCSKNCAWCIEMDVFTDDWAAKQWYCSINIIAQHLDEAWIEAAD